MGNGDIEKGKQIVEFTEVKMTSSSTAYNLMAKMMAQTQINQMLKDGLMMVRTTNKGVKQYKHKGSGNK